MFCDATFSNRSLDKDEDKDGLDSFGHSVAAQIRKLDSRRQALAKVKIQQVLFELEFGAETSDSTQSQGQSILQEAMVARGILDGGQDAWDFGVASDGCKIAHVFMCSAEVVNYLTTDNSGCSVIVFSAMRCCSLSRNKAVKTVYFYSLSSKLSW